MLAHACRRSTEACLRAKTCATFRAFVYFITKSLLVYTLQDAHRTFATVGTARTAVSKWKHVLLLGARCWLWHDCSRSEYIYSDPT